ncbi:hypothetical protein JBE27_45970, partial [Streptomyces albiflaviniger]|nr:hypothetical protein [Streptomyces albiflaviniger]
MSNSTELTAPAGASGSPPEGRSPFRARLGSRLGARPGSRPGAWPAVVAVAVGTFAVVTTEMLPVGLLTSIGSALGVSDGTA